MPPSPCTGLACSGYGSVHTRVYHGKAISVSVVSPRGVAFWERRLGDHSECKLVNTPIKNLDLVILQIPLKKTASTCTHLTCGVHDPELDISVNSMFAVICRRPSRNGNWDPCAFGIVRGAEPGRTGIHTVTLHSPGPLIAIRRGAQ